jgi:sulfite reductase (NADPH) hemoprotein beta-component
VLAAYARERANGEHFGDYVIRAGFISASGNGRDFHHVTGAKRRA